MIWVIVTRRFGDDRGWFSESYNARTLEAAGLKTSFVQDNHSLSRKAYTVRGLHFQKPPFAQAKLVRCLRGRLLDFFVDIRRGSPTFGKWGSVELCGESEKQILIPEGYAHGFVTLEPDTEIFYKASSFYDPKHEGGLRWNDPDVGISWPIPLNAAILSDRDAKLPFMREFDSPFSYEGDPFEIRTVHQ